MPCSSHEDVMRSKKKKKTTFQIVKHAIIRFINNQQYLTLNTLNVQFSYSVMSNSLRPHGLQHATLPCPSPTPGVQAHVHHIGDVIESSHPLSSPSPLTFSLSQHHGLFQ